MHGFMTCENLEQGIKTFRERWPSEADLHNSFYANLSDALRGGLNAESWEDSRGRAVRVAGDQTATQAGDP